MPPEFPAPATPRDWLRYAQSDFAIACQAQASPLILLQTLCFHAQQTVEKSIKAVLLQQGIPFPYSHDLARLITLVHSNEIAWRTEMDQAAGLTVYALAGRYPGVVPAITVAEYQQAIAMAEQVLNWAENLVEESR